MINVLPKLFEKVPLYIEQKDQRFFVFCNYVFFYALVAHILFVPIFYSLGNMLVLTNNLIAIFLDILCLILNNKGFMKVASFLWICEVAIHSSICIIVYGWEHGYYYYLLSLVVMACFSRWRLINRLLVSSLLLVTSLYLFHYSQSHPPVSSIDQQFLFFIHSSNAMANFVALAYASFYYRRSSELMEKQLLKIANTDALTGICNRRSFEIKAEMELKRHDVNLKKCALFILDIDHFKNVNDTFGHTVGDMALQKVAQACQYSLKDSDIFGRIGGEEFAIFLVHTEYQMAIQVAEQIRKIINDTILTLKDGREIHLSASIGVAGPKSKNESLSRLMVRADQALYQAKNEGRNRVVIGT